MKPTDDDIRPVLPDAAAREAIARDVEVNMVVEAAAGTGKTTSLVARLLTLFKRGALAGDGRLAAVTFTHKAAAELRERLERELARELAAADGLAGDERKNLAAAAAALPECHIGTIHSFCARLLRERPVEAGIGLDFSELDQSADLLLRREAWGQFAAALRRGEYAAPQAVFQTFGLDLEALAAGFAQFAEYPDVDEWIGDVRDAGDVDAGAFYRAVAEYRASLGSLLAAIDEAGDPGTDEIIPCLQTLSRRWERLTPPLSLADAFALAGIFRPADRFKVRKWAELFGLGKQAVAEARDGYERFMDEAVRPFRRDCLAVVYAAALAAFRAAGTIYERLRRERRAVNFQDLLQQTARLLRDYPEVRADLAARYPRLLIDEVQDTDPVQAEIMFLLASGDVAENDWRRCRPRPGSLFIVGDPKQSIYRFRRADIVVYQEVKALLEKAGGRILGLTSNFRSQPEVLAWVNQTFCLPEADARPPEAVAKSGKFSRSESPYSPAYMDLQPGRAATPGAFSGVYYLESEPTGLANDAEARTRDLARRIAAFIRHAVDGGLAIPEGDAARPATPADFLIVTYRKGQAAVYADAVRALDLSCQVSSGTTLADSRVLGLLAGYLRALAAPDDAVLCTAALRGALFGVSDAELYRWKKAGGGFHLLAARPAGDASPVADAFARMAEHRRRLRTLRPTLALERIVDDLGLWALAGSGATGRIEAGALAAALDLLREDANAVSTPGGLAERLEWLIENHEDDPLPVAAADGGAVRVMNLHKTKGLEAPVVFLTCPRTERTHAPTFVVRRGETVRGALSLAGGGEFPTVMAQPAEWEALAAEEALFLAAEKTRLNYVAATRAGAALVVTVHKMGGKGKKGKDAGSWNCSYLPEFRPGETIVQPLPEPGAPPAAPAARRAGLEADAPARREAERRRRRETMLTPTYGVVRAKPGGDLEAGPDASSAEMDAGEVLHRLLAANAAGEELRAMAEALVREYRIADADAATLAGMAEAARRSAVWKRAARAEQVFREAPYAIRVEGEGSASLQRGVIDLVFRESAGWVIVDYKSDKLPPGSDPRAAAERHAEQLAAYARAWRALTGEAVAETGIYFLRSGRYVEMPVRD